MITVTTRLRAAEGRQDELEAALRAVCACAEACPGCQRSEASRSAHDAQRFLLVTCFRDEAAHAAHVNSESFARTLPAMMECLEGHPDIEIYAEL